MKTERLSTVFPRSAPAGRIRSRTVSWSKRFGLAGFLFFLCKGLLWLAVLAAAWRLH